MNKKKPLTYGEQIALIRQKGFVIYDDEIEDCITFLKKVNYYRLSAYFLPFMRPDRTFEEGVSFFRLRRIYEFDSRLRSLIFEVIEDVEVCLRTQLSYYVSQKYGAFGYLNDAMYSRRHDEHHFLGLIRRCVEQNRDSPVIRQSQAKNDGKVPLWIIVEFFTVGMLSNFFSDMKTADQKEIAGSRLPDRCKADGKLASLSDGSQKPLCPLSSPLWLDLQLCAAHAAGFCI